MKLNDFLNSPLKLIGFILLLGIVCASSFILERLFDPPWIDATVQYHISDFDQFTLYWSKEDVFIDYSDRANFLAVGEDGIFINSSFNKYANPGFYGLDKENGTINWKKAGGNELSGIVNNISNNSDLVFVGFGGTGKAIDSSPEGSGRVIAIDIESGEEIWSQVIWGMRETESIIGDDEFVGIDGGYFSHKYYLLDANNGTIISSLDKADTGYTHQLPANNYGYWAASSLNSSQTNILESSIFWRDLFNVGNVYRQVIVQQDLVVQRTNKDLGGYVQVIESKTGEIIWTSQEQAISNLAVVDSTVFYLTKNAELIASNIYTGEKIGFVQFTPMETSHDDDFGYYISANKDFVATYFGDGRELFVFHYANSE